MALPEAGEIGQSQRLQPPVLWTGQLTNG